MKSISIDRVLCIAGPTASGKSDLAEIFSERFDLPVLSVDSMQVYRGLDIGTAKPKTEKRKRYRLIDLIEPGNCFSAADYVKQAVDLTAGSDRAIFAGGTGLYYEALFRGLADIPPIDELVSTGIGDLERNGIDTLADALRSEDPLAAQSVDLKNPRRVSRALAVWRSTGRSIVDWQKRTKPAILPKDCLWVGLDPGVDVLDQRIEKRCREMFEAGWPKEASQLVERYSEEAVLKTGAIGYSEALQVSRGSLDRSQALDSVMLQTRQFARRQRTYFKNRMDIRWFSEPEKALQAAKGILEP